MIMMMRISSHLEGRLGLTRKINFNLIIINEYKFYVDFKGMMYFDDGGPISPTNIIKDKKFIAKFYNSLKLN